jgi:hypothetical protein
MSIPPSLAQGLCWALSAAVGRVLASSASTPARMRDPGTGYVKEGGLGSILHRALVDPDRLYPWTSDPAGFKQDLTTRAPADQINEVEQRIRDAGYLGYYVEDDGNVRSPSAPLGNVAACSRRSLSSLCVRSASRAARCTRSLLLSMPLPAPAT